MGFVREYLWVPTQVRPGSLAGATGPVGFPSTLCGLYKTVLFFGFFLRLSCGHRSLGFLPPQAAVPGALPALGGLTLGYRSLHCALQSHQEMIIPKTSNTQPGR